MLIKRILTSEVNISPSFNTNEEQVKLQKNASVITSVIKSSKKKNKELIFSKTPQSIETKPKGPPVRRKLTKGSPEAKARMQSCAAQSSKKER